MFDKLKEKFAKREEENEMVFKPLDESTKEETAPAAPSEPTAAPEGDTHAPSVELKVLRPETYEEVSVAADNLIAGCTVVLNMEVLDKPTMLRMLDFLNGVAYCLDGEIKRVAPTTFIITPHGDVDISDM
ncbi:MAG: cell division protein SepF [Clostridia bacterium]|nr:cell division protein SepF [Clostridia bacterium]MBR3680481.1 cell division protein SepF [Clostridia bacterium]